MKEDAKVEQSVVSSETKAPGGLDAGHVHDEDTQDKLHCAVSASKRIYKRAKKLKIEAHRPIAVFTECKGNEKICFIDDIHISKLLKEAANKVHGITCKK